MHMDKKSNTQGIPVIYHKKEYSTVKSLSNHLGFTKNQYRTLLTQLKRGKTPDEAVNFVLRYRLNYEGVHFSSITAFAEYVGGNACTVSALLKKGYTPDDIAVIVKYVKGFTYDNRDYKNLFIFCKVQKIDARLLLSKLKQGITLEQAVADLKPEVPSSQSDQEESDTEVPLSTELKDKKTKRHGVVYKGIFYANVEALAQTYHVSYTRLTEGICTIRKNKGSDYTDKDIKEVIDALQNTGYKAPVEYEGVVYESKAELCRQLDLNLTSIYSIAKDNHISFIEAVDLYTDRHTPIEIDGVLYKDETDFQKQTGIDLARLNRIGRKYGVSDFTRRVYLLANYYKLPSECRTLSACKSKNLNIPCVVCGKIVKGSVQTAINHMDKCTDRLERRCKLFVPKTYAKKHPWVSPEPVDLVELPKDIKFMYSDFSKNLSDEVDK